MKYEILNYLLPLAGVSLVLGLLLGWPSKHRTKQFDERQLIEQGKAARLAITVVVAYLLAFFVTLSFWEVPQELLLPLVVAGMMLAAMVDRAYCIFHDAAISNEKHPMTEGGLQVILGMVWFALAIMTWPRQQDSGAIQFMISIEFVFEGLCLMIRFLYLRARSKKEGEE
jgi:uncharacterized membrane protein HdeD (DUF308 family)